MKTKKAVFDVIPTELLGLLIFAVLFFGLWYSGVLDPVIELFTNKEDQEARNQFTRLELTIEKLPKGGVDFFPNSINFEEEDVYSLSLIPKCKGDEYKGCRDDTAQICLISAKEGKKPYCVPVENTEFESSSTTIIKSNYIIKKSNKNFVTMIESEVT